MNSNPVFLLLLLGSWLYINSVIPFTALSSAPAEVEEMVSLVGTYSIESRSSTCTVRAGGGGRGWKKKKKSVLK